MGILMILMATSVAKAETITIVADAWRFTDLDSIKQIRLATIGGYDYRKWLNNYIQSTPRNSDKVQILLADLPLQRNLNKLLLDRVDVVCVSGKL